MNLRTLRKRALDGTLEVEDLLKAASEGQPGLGDELQRLSAECGWAEDGQLENGMRVVPLAKWAEIASSYSSGAFEALARLVENPENTPFILGLLEEIMSTEALDFILREYAQLIEAPSRSEETSFRIASSLNLMLSFTPSAPLNSAQAETIQSFLFALFPLAHAENQRALVILALRGVGDERAIRFISDATDLQAPWHQVKRVSLRSIRKRLKENAC